MIRIEVCYYLNSLIGHRNKVGSLGISESRKIIDSLRQKIKPFLGLFLAPPIEQCVS
jgi:hypothetical protein